MRSNALKIGDLVQLLAGGQQMVVVGRNSVTVIPRQIEVAWFEPRGKLRRAWLPEQALRQVELDAAETEA